ncbi:MAG: dual specificity protein phosphatase family protein [Myxococcota bacterium]
MRTAIYWIERPGEQVGGLAIAPRPRGQDWLEDEASDWRAQGVDHVVSMLTSGEVEELDLTEEQKVLAVVSIGFTSCPVEDRSTPESRVSFLSEAEAVHRRRVGGESVLIHCRQGIGRSSLLAAAALQLQGVPLDEAWDQITKARGRQVPDTKEQKDWLGE